MSDDPAAHIAHLHDRISHLEGLIERTHRTGKVTDVDYSDAKKPRFRMEIGKDENGQSVKSPWIPHVQHAGDRTVHTPLTKGQTMLMISPDGNFESALAMPYGFSQNNQSPSTSETDHVDKMGDVKTTLNKNSHTRETKGATIVQDGSGLKITCEGTTFAFTSSGFAQQGGNLTHDGKHIDATHVHDGVQCGGAQTNPPAN